MGLIKDKRNRTKELLAKLPEFLEEACHCTISTIQGKAHRIKVHDKEESSDLLGRISLDVNYEDERIHLFVGEYEEIMFSADEDIINIRKVALVMNALRIEAGVQCDDWEEVKVALATVIK